MNHIIHRPRRLTYVLTLVSVCSVVAQLRAATASPLYARGYTVIPQPQRVMLSGKDFEMTSGWRLE